MIPTGYSFNLDGTNTYMTLALPFLALATNTPLTLGQELTILLLVAMLDRGRLGRHGGGLRDARGHAVHHSGHPDPVACDLVGIGKFMGECRALATLVRNGVATIVTGRWEGELDPAKRHDVMARPVEIGEEIERQAT